jgi:HEAT repeat protein
MNGRRRFLVGGAILLFAGAGLVVWLAASRRPHVVAMPGLDAAALTSLTAEAVPGHVAALGHADGTVRQKAAKALWQIGASASAATPALLEAAKDPDPQVRYWAAKALGRTSQRTSDAVLVLTAALQDQEAEVRATAAASLAEIWWASSGTPAAAGRGGEQAPRAPSVQLSPETAAAAGPAVPALTETLADPDAATRRNAAMALAAVGPLAVPALGKLRAVLGTDPDDLARVWAAAALGSIGPAAKAGIPSLIRGLREDKFTGVRLNCAIALNSIRCEPEAAVPALVEAYLRDEDLEVRGVSLMCLRGFGAAAKGAIPLLRRAEKDPKYQQVPDLHERVSRALKQLEG